MQVYCIRVNAAQERHGMDEQEIYQLVVDEMQAAVFGWNLMTGEFNCSENYKNYAISSVPPDLILANKGSEDVVFHDDLHAMLKFFTDTVSGEHRAETVLRLKMTAGGYRWCKLIGLFYKDGNGKPNRTIGIIIDIDDSMKAQKALEEANGQLQKQYRHEASELKILEKDSEVAIQFDVTKDKLVSYRSNQKFYGDFKAGEAGTSIRPGITEKIPTAEERSIADDFFSRDKALEKFQNGEKEFSAVYRRRLANGRLCWFSATCRLAQDEENGDLISYTYMRNIDTERKKELTAEAVIDKETEYVVLLNTISHTAMLIFLKNSLQMADYRLYKEFPFSDIADRREFRNVEEDDRKNITDFFSEQNLIKRLGNEQVIKSTYRRNYQDNSIRRKKMRAFYLDSTHEDIVIDQRDITDLYEEEQEQKRVLQTALNEANAANRAKSDFLSRMSHDLRTPMNVIMGLSSLAMDSVNDPKETEKALSNIIESSKYLLSLVNDSLDMEKINSGKLVLHPIAYPYIDFYNDVNAVIGPMCSVKNIAFVIDEPDTVEPIIVADKTRVEQIFYNLLSNAVRYTQNGGKVEMLTRNSVIRNGCVEFDSIVRDNGVGMSDEFQKHMFEAFAQEENEITPQYGGTGLGLTIVRQLTDLMGADISVKSRLGEGTEIKIHFVFPVANATDFAVKEKAPESFEKLCGKRVLLVEDHPVNQIIAWKLLDKVGVHVTSVGNGQEALNRFRATTPEYFDAILMDIRMPIMNGLEATRKIRELDKPDAGTVPIIAMTANAYDTDVEASLKAGMNAHLSKPIEPDSLYETLCEFIK